MDYLQQSGVREIIELGPGRILGGQLKRSHPDFQLGSLDESAAILPSENLRVSG
jgi:hypothetical protein